MQYQLDTFSMADQSDDSPAGAPDAKSPLSGMRCLVLEDEFMIALDIQQILEAAGAAVVCVSSVEAALSALESGPAFTLAVLDVWLSLEQQSSAAVALALSRARTPFVFLTGMEEDNIHTRPFPSAPVVEKPYQTALLLMALRRALGTR